MTRSFCLAIGLALTAGGGQFIYHVPSAATYTLPNNDADCPANCRQIPWSAGLDIWNSGVAPTRTEVNCTTGLTEGNGTTDNTTAINNCLAAISAGEASKLPAGIYYVNGNLSIPANKSLHGQTAWDGCTQSTGNQALSASFHGDTSGGATCTTIKLGASGNVIMDGQASLGSSYNLSSGYTKGSTAVVASSTPTNIAANDWIIISETADNNIPVVGSGENGACTWCGEQNAASRFMTQVVQVTSVSGNTVNLSRPLYYTFVAGSTPRIIEITNVSEKIGLKNLKIWGSSTSRTNAAIDAEGCMLCWIDNVEVYDIPDVGKAWHLYVSYSYGLDVTGSYFHHGQGNDGDRNYSPGLFGPVSDVKYWNNISRGWRHGPGLEGGGSGNAFLYNYWDDGWTDDCTYLASGRFTHGPHPYMNLYEGNIWSHVAADSIFGSSSHNVVFRNWLWGDETGAADNPCFAGGNPNYGFVAVDVTQFNVYYAFIGNLLGRHDNLHANWNNAVLSGTCGTHTGSRTTPVVFFFGCDTSYGTPAGGQQATPRSTAILHGNYDFKTDGVNDWDGGSNHALGNSLYYGSKPSFLGSCAFPTYGPDASPTTPNVLPAKQRFNGSTCP